MKIRTLMVASFLIVAAFTPAVALLSHQAVSETGEVTQESINHSLNVINASKEVVSTSEAILIDLNNIEEHLAADETPEALVDMDKLDRHYSEFSNATERLNQVLNGTETGARLSEELNTLNQAEERLGEEVQYTRRSARTGSTISQEMIDELRTDYQDVSSAAATINAEIIESESDKLLATHSELTELSSTIVVMGGIVVMLSFAIAGIASFKLSRPIRKLSGEAEKIKNEKFEEVDLGSVDPSTDEIAELKNIMSQTLLAMKAEFGRERSEMNQLALDVSKVLYGQVPQGTAESSITSACKKIDVDPTELEEEDLEELADQLEITMKGLGVDDRIFEEIRKMS